jgi:hypothetical protein
VSDPQLPEPEDRVNERPSIPDQRPPEAPVSGPAAPPAAAGQAKKPPRWKTALIVVAGVLALLCVGGLGSAYFYYRKVSEPDRRTPAVVLEQFVEAKLNERDQSRAATLTCRSTSFAQLDQLSADLRAREHQFDTTFTVQTADLVVRQRDGTADVDTDLQISTPESRSTQRWRFAMKNQSGWRVCAAERVG